MKRALASAVAALALTLGRAAVAEPPPGWVEPEPLPVKPAKPKLPACCGVDDTCCSRQAEIDGATPPRFLRALEVNASTLPEALQKEAARDQPGVEGSPNVRVIDGRGRPPPWADGPKSEIRVMPPGRFGQMQWKDWSFPFFSDPPLRSLGYGITHFIDSKLGETAASVLTGPVNYSAFARGEGDAVTVDLLSGTLEGAPEARVRHWLHAEAVPVAEGLMHAFREKHPRGPLVSFVLPNAIVEARSNAAALEGGFFPDRLSSSEAFTMITVPAGPGRSGAATLQMFGSEVEHWFARPKGSAKPLPLLHLTISSSQTSVEAEPKVRVLLFAGRAR